MPTPLLHSQQLSELLQGQVYLKLENTQVAGSFKVRGALQVMAALSGSEKERGVVAPTAGNHGMALAYAGKAAGVPVQIFLPATADLYKVRFMEKQGAKISYFPDIETARQAALVAARDQGLTFVSAYNNPHMVTGAGTLGLELLAEKPDLDMVLACTGGGGLAAGLGLYLKAQNPHLRLVSVQTENSPTFATWFRQGQTTEVALTPSIAEGLSGYIDPTTITFPLFLQVVDEVITVSEAEMIAAMKWLLEEHNLVTEPSGVAAVAALLAGKVAAPNQQLAAIVTGGNISPHRFGDLVRLHRSTSS